MRALYHHRTQGRDVEAVHIRGFAGGLERLGIEVEIVGPPGVTTDPNAVTQPGAKKKPILLSLLARHAPQAMFELMEVGYNLAAVPRLWKRCQGEKPVLLYERYALYNASGVITGRLRGIPVVLELNDIVKSDRTRQGKRLVMPWLAAAFERWILRHADGIVVVSGYLRDQLIEMGLPAKKVLVTPNAVDAERFDPERVSGEEVRARYGLEGKTVIGFAGSFAKWHGPDLLVRAFASLAEQHPDLRLLLVGDGALMSQTQELTRELGIAERVVFTGRLPHAEIPAHVAEMDVGVMPQSNAFGSPMKVFEYQAMGKPAVGPRYRPLEEAIDDGTTGLLFEPGDEAGLARCLRFLVEDPDQRAQMGRAARRKVLARHLWEHNAQAVLDLVRARCARIQGSEVRVQA